ncbi:MULTISPECIES: N-acetylglucosamine-6-phosphate deacetylase [Flaviflexus]|uniref:N-acetylglucosamine-6-phosphate deacetylase n=1 Tax=Flaviflexus TaxID=1522056 RepID=UPI0013DF6127|nr:amidohydrolase family protein [Flaviflexus ciconiae]
MEKINATVLDAAGHIIGSSITLEDGVVRNVAPPTEELRGPYFFPGFVDIHCHGGGGASFPDDNDRESIERAARTHAHEGTTHLIASLVSALDPLPAIKALADACDDGLLIGIHLEGPYVSHEKAGAQNPAAIRDINLDELATWLEAGRGWIKTMTIAPERERSVEAAQLLLQHGAVPSWGHTAASSRQTSEAVSATSKIAGGLRPAQTATHLFNAMPPLNHRFPGPVRELMDAAKYGDLVVEIIGDGVHVATELVADCLNYLDDPVEPGAALVTDALACAAMPNGDYVLGGLAVTMVDGTAKLTGTDTIAGGASTLARQVIKLLDYGVDPRVLARATMLAPARAINIDPPAYPAPGRPLTGVLIDGAELRAWRDGVEYGNV